MHRRRFLQLIGIAPPTLVFATACSGGSSGVTVKIDHGPVARLGETMIFMMTATSVRDAPDLSKEVTPGNNAGVTFSFSSGLNSSDSDWKIERIDDGRTNYRRDIVFKAQVPQSFEIQVKLDQLGEHWVRAAAGSTNPSSRSAIDTLYLKVDSEKTSIQRMPFSQ